MGKQGAATPAGARHMQHATTQPTTQRRGKRQSEGNVRSDEEEVRIRTRTVHVSRQRHRRRAPHAVRRDLEPVRAQHVVFAAKANTKNVRATVSQLRPTRPDAGHRFISGLKQGRDDPLASQSQKQATAASACQNRVRAPCSANSKEEDQRETHMEKDWWLPIWSPNLRLKSSSPCAEEHAKGFDAR